MAKSSNNRSLLNRATAALGVIGATLFIVGSPYAYAQSAPSTPGYTVISPSQPTSSGSKVEVIEVFSYGCIHCAQFQPYVDAWAKKLDKSTVQFSYLPAPFNPLFRLMARGYYAADSLGVTASTHQKVFNALFEQGKQVRDIDSLASLYASLGVNRDAFIKSAESFFVESQVRRADELMNKYQIDGTPTVIVAGKYRITGDSAGGHDKVFAVVDKLIAKELAAVKTSPVKR
jgi:protein dithiol oxidoreductase (disulfide-forming)